MIKIRDILKEVEVSSPLGLIVIKFDTYLLERNLGPATLETEVFELSGNSPSKAAENLYIEEAKRQFYTDRPTPEEDPFWNEVEVLGILKYFAEVYHDNDNTVALSGYSNEYGGYAFLVTSTSNPDYYKFDKHVGFKGEPNSHPSELDTLISQYILDLTYGIKHGISKSYKIPASVFDNMKP